MVFSYSSFNSYDNVLNASASSPSVDSPRACTGCIRVWSWSRDGGAGEIEDENPRGRNGSKGKADGIAEVHLQTCVLEVKINGNVCKEKIKKILQEIDGVFKIIIDSEQGKVTVSGNVDPALLIEKLAKSGKRAEIWGAQKPSNRNKNNNQSHLNNPLKNMEIDNGKGSNKTVKSNLPQENLGDHDSDEYGDESDDEYGDEFDEFSESEFADELAKKFGGGGLPQDTITGYNGGGGGGSDNESGQNGGQNGDHNVNNSNGKKGGGSGSGNGKNEGLNSMNNCNFHMGGPQGNGRAMGNGNLGQMGGMNIPMGQMGNLSTGQMGCIPTVRGASGSPYFQGGTGQAAVILDNLYVQQQQLLQQQQHHQLLLQHQQQQQQQQQQCLAALMNQQWAMDNERFQPMMYAQPPSTVNYAPPRPNPFPRGLPTGRAGGGPIFQGATGQASVIPGNPYLQQQQQPRQQQQQQQQQQQLRQYLAALMNSTTGDGQGAVPTHNVRPAASSSRLCPASSSGGSVHPLLQ
ncbi:hypothetical protein ACJRO7_010315 [Eucalyptus globulus]|uniref:HMA domain-containing protein n=2 Tax=Eucalyptus globulus TaxID=34317 RepID=A0ABD3LBT9_EUCGL